VFRKCARCQMTPSTASVDRRRGGFT
jgi:hypothetical protein